MRDQYEDFEKLIEAGELSTAELRLFEWIRDHPNDSYAWLLYGRSVSNPAQKRDCFKRALALDPSNLEAREFLDQLEATSSPMYQNKEQPRGNAPSSASSPPYSINIRPQFSALKPPVLSEQSKKRLAFTLYTFFHFLMTVFLAIALVWLFASLVPGLLRFDRSSETIQRNWLSNVSPSDANQEMKDLATIFLNPSRLDFRTVNTYQELRSHRTSISASSSNTPLEFTGVSFTGQLTSGYVLEQGSDGQPLVVVMNILFSETRIPVVYYGPSDQFKYEDMVLVKGVYIDEANGIAAQHVEQLSTDHKQIDSPTLTLLRIAGLVLLWSLFCFSVFFWRVNQKAFRQANIASSPYVIVLILLLHALWISGCTIDLSTTLQPDGAGVTSILVNESRENMEFLRSAPGVPGYLSAVIRDMQNSGAMFEQYVEGEQELFFIQRHFNTSNADVGDTYPIEGSWISVERYRQGNEEVMRFLGVVDTRTLYNTPDTIDSNVAGALRDQLDQIEMNYHLHFPGQLVYHNGATTADREVSWKLRMNDINYLVAEVRLPLEQSRLAGFDVRLIWLAVGGIFIIASGFLIGSIWVRPVRQAGRKS